MTRVGILGGGQLGRMLALAAHRLGVAVQVLDPVAGAPAGAVAPLTVARFDDGEELDAFAAGCDAVTFEVETVPAAALRRLAAGGAEVAPGPASLEVAGDRRAEKALFEKLGIGTAQWAPVEARGALDVALATIGLPAMLKRCHGGFDGRGQRLAATTAAAREAAAELAGPAGDPLIVERAVSFRRELSVTVVRARDGDAVVYPLAENVTRDGMLAYSRVPAPAGPWVIAQAQAHALAVAEELGHVGALTLELLDTGDELLALEIAPRVHNTAHWTIEGARTSQFENHLRAVLGLPLGSPAALGGAALVNLIGRPPLLADLLAVDGAAVHLYGKEPRPGRKVGHVTLVDTDGPSARLDARLAQVISLAERSSSNGNPCAVR